MKIKGFIWFEEIIEKLDRKHHVRQEEVREVFANRPKFSVSLKRDIILEKMSMQPWATQMRVVA